MRRSLRFTTAVCCGPPHRSRCRSIPTVQLWIQSPPLGDAAETHRREVVAARVAAGLTLPTLGTSPALPLSEAERDDLARRIPSGRPLSEIIIEEREVRGLS